MNHYKICLAPSGIDSDNNLTLKLFCFSSCMQLKIIKFSGLPKGILKQVLLKSETPNGIGGIKMEIQQNPRVGSPTTTYNWQPLQGWFIKRFISPRYRFTGGFRILGMYNIYRELLTEFFTKPSLMTVFSCSFSSEPKLRFPEKNISLKIPEASTAPGFLNKQI